MFLPSFWQLIVLVLVLVLVLVQVIPKPEATAQLILTAIEHSVLFKNCGKEDFTMLVEAFAPVSFPKGSQVITQVLYTYRQFFGATGM